jgi:Tfp pilus assembly protein PilF
MLERCVRLDAAYIPAYLLLARLYQGQEGRGPAVERLLRHVARLQPNSPDHLAELAAWLHQQGESDNTPPRPEKPKKYCHFIVVVKYE